MTVPKFDTRLRIVLIVIYFIILVIIAKLIYLQVIKHHFFIDKNNKNVVLQGYCPITPYNITARILFVLSLFQQS